MHDIEIKWWFFIFIFQIAHGQCLHLTITKQNIKSKTNKQKQSKTKKNKSWFLNTRCTYSECRA